MFMLANFRTVYFFLQMAFAPFATFCRSGYLIYSWSLSLLLLSLGNSDVLLSLYCATAAVARVDLDMDLS